MTPEQILSFALLTPEEQEAVFSSMTPDEAYKLSLDLRELGYRIDNAEALIGKTFDLWSYILKSKDQTE